MTIPSDVQIWRCDTRSYAWTRSADPPLSLSESSRASRLQRPEGRREFVAAHAALRQILAGWTGISARELRFETRCSFCGDSFHGRPVLANERDRVSAGPYFNLSRSDGIALIAVSDVGAVGVDVEAVGPVGKWDLIGGRVFTEAEASSLSELGPVLTAAAAARLWTRKEAVSKAIGLGLALPFDALGVGDPSACSWIAARLPAMASELPLRSPALVRDVPVPDGYAAAVGLIGGAITARLVLHDI